MKGLIQIQIIIYLLLNLTTQAAININTQPTNDYLIIVEIVDSTISQKQIEQKQLEKRTFRIGDKINYSTNENFRIQEGEIVGFYEENIFIKTETSALKIPIENLKSIQKSSKWYKPYRKNRKLSLILGIVTTVFYLIISAIIGSLFLYGVASFLGGTMTMSGLVFGILGIATLGLFLNILLIALGFALLFTLIYFIASRSKTPKYRLGKRWIAKLK